jgi:hypothetical protein
MTLSDLTLACVFEALRFFFLVDKKICGLVVLLVCFLLTEAKRSSKRPLWWQILKPTAG